MSRQYVVVHLGPVADVSEMAVREECPSLTSPVTRTSIKAVGFAAVLYPGRLECPHRYDLKAVGSAIDYSEEHPKVKLDTQPNFLLIRVRINARSMIK